VQWWPFFHASNSFARIAKPVVKMNVQGRKIESNGTNAVLQELTRWNCSRKNICNDSYLKTNK
jgi:hypothetical protein